MALRHTLLLQFTNISDGVAPLKALSRALARVRSLSVCLSISQVRVDQSNTCAEMHRRTELGAEGVTGYDILDAHVLF